MSDEVGLLVQELRQQLAALRTASGVGQPPPHSHRESVVASQPPASQPPASQVHSIIPSQPPTQIQIPSLSQAQPAASSSTGPIIHPYTSVRLQGLGHPSTMPMHSHPSPRNPPFPAMPALPPSLSTTHVNNARLASASATLPPRAPARTIRQSRRSTRGVAQQPPATAGPSRSARSNIDPACYVPGPNGSRLLAIRVKVYPRSLTIGQDFFMYPLSQGSFNAFLERYRLLWNYELSSETTIHDVMQRVLEDMQSSDMQYVFHRQANTHYLPHETLPFYCMEVVNKGRPRASDGQIRLRVSRSVGPDFRLAGLDDKNRFSPSVCIEGSVLSVHFVLRVPVYMTIEERRHTCLSVRLYSTFPQDSPYGHVETHEDAETSGGEEIADDDVEMADVQTLLAAPTRSPSPEIPLAGPSTRSLAMRHRVFIQGSSGSRSIAGRTPSFAAAESFLPAQIWVEPWSSVGPQTVVAYRVDSLPSLVFDVASDSNVTTRIPSLEVRGANVEEVAKVLLSKIAEAAAVDDYTEVLAPHREFFITDNEGTSSFGSGIEREAVYMAWTIYSRQSTWFKERLDGFATLQTAHSASTAMHTSPDRLIGMKMLGALSALMMAYKMPPYPLDPAIFQFIIHGCRLDSLHKAFVGEWHPELKTTIADWIALGPDGDPSPFTSHFASYHDLAVSSLRLRNSTSHMSLASEMLYRAVIGPEPHRHPEWQQFIAGFCLPCKNGFDFLEVPKCFQGGSEMFLNLIWSSYIPSSDSLRDRVRIILPIVQRRNELDLAIGHPTPFASLLSNFFLGPGVPCPKLFEEFVKGMVHPLVDLSTTDNHGFRSRIFTWAATGTPLLDPNPDNRISVRFVEDDDESYADPEMGWDRDNIIKNGKISFRTCFKTVRVPSSYILKLANQTYSDEAEPHSFQQAFDHWFFSECISSIGGHNMG